MFLREQKEENGAMLLPIVTESPEAFGDNLFGDNFKIAADAARLLDWAEEIARTGRDTYIPGGAILALYEMLNVCLDYAGIAPVPMDPMWAYPLAQAALGWDEHHKTEVQKLHARISLMGQDGDFYDLLKEYPKIGSDAHRRDYNIVTEEDVRLVMNAVFCSRGRAMTRNYMHIVKPPTKTKLPKPWEPIKVLCVDDGTAYILQTFLKLIGYVNWELVPYLQPNTTNEGESVAQQIAQDVIASGAHIILMDQGLRHTEGSDVVQAMRQLDPQRRQIVVANTGGAPDKLYQVGALKNCDKGRELLGLQDAFHQLMHRRSH